MKSYIFFFLSLVAFAIYAWTLVTTGIPHIHSLMLAMFLIILYREEE